MNISPVFELQTLWTNKFKQPLLTTIQAYQTISNHDLITRENSSAISKSKSKKRRNEALT